MAVILGLGLTMTMLIWAVLSGAYIGWPLALGYAYFLVLLLLRGRKPAQLWAMTREGAARAFIVIPILLLIGCLTALWMAAGTVGALVYYSLALIRPGLFIVFAFILSSLISMLLGTALGTVGTVGVMLMVLARGGGVEPALAAGAIISGAYVGDRCSPMSSALHLLSAVTETEAYDNVKMTFATTLAPYALALVLFLAVSLANPLLAGETTLKQDILKNFRLGLPALIPAALIIALAAFKVNVKISMLVSAVSALVTALFVQKMAAGQVILTIMRGFNLPESNPLAHIIHGGGVWGMLKTSFVLLAACSLIGVLEGSGMLKALEKRLDKSCGRLALYLKTLGIAALAVAGGCNQTISIILTSRVMKTPYQLNGLDKHDLARDISFTSVPLAAIIPWNMGAMVPITTLGISGAAHIPYLFFPLLVIIYYGARHALAGKKGAKRRSA